MLDIWREGSVSIGLSEERKLLRAHYLELESIRYRPHIVGIVRDRQSAGDA